MTPILLLLNFFAQNKAVKFVRKLTSFVTKYFGPTETNNCKALFAMFVKGGRPNDSAVGTTICISILTVLSEKINDTGEIWTNAASNAIYEQNHV